MTVRYPNLYPDWTHLHYGRLTTGFEISDCMMSPGSEYLFVHTENPVGWRVYHKAKLRNVDFRRPMQLPFLPSPLDVSSEMVDDAYHFWIVHPRDAFDLIFVDVELPKVFDYRTNGVTIPTVLPAPQLANVNAAIPTKWKLSLGESGMVAYSDDAVFYASYQDLQDSSVSPWQTMEIGHSPTVNLHARVATAAIIHHDTLIIVTVDGESESESESGSNKERISVQWHAGCAPAVSQRLLLGDSESIKCREPCLVTLNPQSATLVVASSSSSSSQGGLFCHANLPVTPETLSQTLNMKCVETMAMLKGMTMTISSDSLPLRQVAVAGDGAMVLVEMADRTLLLMDVAKGKITSSSPLRVSPKGSASSSSVAAAFITFSRHYLWWATGLEHDHQIQILKRDWEDVDPRIENARITDFYLPPAPVSGAEEQIPDNELYNGISIEMWGIWHMPSFVVLPLLMLALLLTNTMAVQLQMRMVRKSAFIQTLLRWCNSARFFALATCVLFCFSLMEIVFQSPILNDWPAHLHHLDNFRAGVRHYDSFMHYHGPNTYPAGFMVLYTGLDAVANASAQVYQLLWASMEMGNFWILRSLCLALELPPALALFAVASNRLHLYNVRVLINDFPTMVLLHGSLLLAAKRRPFWSALIFALSFSTKMNVIAYLPSLVWLVWLEFGMLTVLLACVIFVSVNVCLAWPFVQSSAAAYLRGAFDLSRTLLWEKTRNFKWVGRMQYESREWHMFLLLALLLSLLWLSGWVWRHRQRPLRDPHSRALVLFSSSFFFILWARGLYTPFLSWYFYVFPLLTWSSGLSLLHIAIYWLGTEILFRVWGHFLIEVWTTYLYFLINLSVFLRIIWVTRHGPVTRAVGKEKLA